MNRIHSVSIILSIMTILMLSVDGCYSLRTSAGGGQEQPKKGPREIKTADIAVPPGYRVEVVAQDLTYPTGVAFDDSGRVYIVESGYSYGEDWDIPRLLRIESVDSFTTIAEGDSNGPWNGVTYLNNRFYIAQGGELRGGAILAVGVEGKVDTLVKDLPSNGDHHTDGPAVGPDGMIYFGQGTATNSGVVGIDNAAFGWLYRYPDFHDISCAPCKLIDKKYKTLNPLTPDPSDSAITGPFSSFGTSAPGDSIPGAVPCNGAIMRIPATGGTPSLVAWGFRNPFGLAFSHDNVLYVTENEYDDRGSRPVWGTADYLWRIEEGKWYGWPDFSGGDSIYQDRYAPPGKSKPARLLAVHPGPVPHPVASFGVHSSSNGFDFSRSEKFGYTGEAFVAQFGDMAPGVGKVLGPVGYKVVRVDVTTGVISPFAENKGTQNGPASKLRTGGLERPTAARFSPDGSALYVVDFGIMLTGEKGPKPIRKTGVLWKIVKNTGR